MEADKIRGKSQKFEGEKKKKKEVEPSTSTVKVPETKID